MLKIEMGIGWKPDPNRPGWVTSCNDSDYVAEIERLRAAIKDAWHLIPNDLAGPWAAKHRDVLDAHQ